MNNAKLLAKKLGLVQKYISHQSVNENIQEF